MHELIWVVRDNQYGSGDASGLADATLNTDDGAGTECNDWFNYSGSTDTGAAQTTFAGVLNSELFTDMKLQLNGHDRFAKRNASYFRTCQPIQAGHKVPTKHIYCYSFALKPEEHQPSGSCNFSRIDNAQMNFTGAGTGGTLIVFAVNYNVLRIMSGMGGLAYSN